MNSLAFAIPAYNSAPTLEKCLRALRHSIDSAQLSKSLPYDVPIFVIDDASTDKTYEIAAAHASKVIRHTFNLGSARSRHAIFTETPAEYIGFIDSDIIVPMNYVSSMVSFIEQHPEAAGVTGSISACSPYMDFPSAYKHLYMSYIIGRLPERVTYIYGGCFFLKREFLSYSDFDFPLLGDDTSLGQNILNGGGIILLNKECPVSHLKKFSLARLLLNDFKIPFAWSKIFIKYAGWKQFGQKGTGFAHASMSQLASIGVVASIVFLASLRFFVSINSVLFVALFACWGLFNWPFFAFILENKGKNFLLHSVFFTWIDHFTMGLGISSGFAMSLSGRCHPLGSPRRSENGRS